MFYIKIVNTKRVPFSTNQELDTHSLGIRLFERRKAAAKTKYFMYLIIFDVLKVKLAVVRRKMYFSSDNLKQCSETLFKMLIVFYEY